MPESEGIIRYGISDLRALLCRREDGESRERALKVARELAKAREPRRLFELLDALTDAGADAELGAVRAGVEESLLGLYRSTVFRNRGWGD